MSKSAAEKILDNAKANVPSVNDSPTEQWVNVFESKLIGNFIPFDLEEESDAVLYFEVLVKNVGDLWLTMNRAAVDLPVENSDMGFRLSDVYVEGEHGESVPFIMVKRITENTEGIVSATTGEPYPTLSEPCGLIYVDDEMTDARSGDSISEWWQKMVGAYFRHSNTIDGREWIMDYEEFEAQQAERRQKQAAFSVKNLLKMRG